MLFKEFSDAYESIPDNLLPLFEPHVRQTLDACSAGYNILTWNSLNIGISSNLIIINTQTYNPFISDAFLKSFEVAISRLKTLVSQVTKTKQYEIFKIITEINSMYLFDYDLAFSQKWVRSNFNLFLKKVSNENFFYCRHLMNLLRKSAAPLKLKLIIYLTKLL